MLAKHAPLSGFVLTGLLSAALGLAPANGHANPRALRTLTVPAVSCFTTEHSLEGENPYKGGGRYARFTTGATVLQCPLSVQGPGSLREFNLHYRDRDGFGTDSTVEVRLDRTFVTYEGSLHIEQICHWNSDLDGGGATDYTRTTVPCIHFLRQAFYYFTVTLRVGANEDAGEAEFIGIDFPR